MIPDKATILERMIEADLIDREQVNNAIERCREKDKNLFTELLSAANIPDEQVSEFFLNNFDFQEITLSDLVPNQGLIRRIPAHLMKTHLMIPVCSINKRVFLAVADPLDTDGLRAISGRLGSEITVLLSSKEQIIQAISEYASKPGTISILK